MGFFIPSGKHDRLLGLLGYAHFYGKSSWDRGFQKCQQKYLLYTFKFSGGITVLMGLGGKKFFEKCNKYESVQNREWKQGQKLRTNYKVDVFSFNKFVVVMAARSS